MKDCCEHSKKDISWSISPSVMYTSNLTFCFLLYKLTHLIKLGLFGEQNKVSNLLRLVGDRLSRIHEDILPLSRTSDPALLVNRNEAAPIDNIVLLDDNHILEANAQLPGEFSVTTLRSSVPKTRTRRNSHSQLHPHLCCLNTTDSHLPVRCRGGKPSSKNNPWLSNQ